MNFFKINWQSFHAKLNLAIIPLIFGRFSLLSAHTIISSSGEKIDIFGSP